MGHVALSLPTIGFGDRSSRDMDRVSSGLSILSNVAICGYLLAFLHASAGLLILQKWPDNLSDQSCSLSSKQWGHLPNFPLAAHEYDLHAITIAGAQGETPPIHASA